jgi:glycosyltransferase involved in cell wall biosynthesis
MQKALIISFFPAFSPPSSGGELRLRNLYRSVSGELDVTLLTSTDFGARFEEIRHCETCRELRFPKDDLWRNAYATLDAAGLYGDLSGLAFALAVSDPNCGLRQTARELAGSRDLVIHEFPFSEPIFADGSAAVEIYNSHNFELNLLSSIVRGKAVDDAFAKLMRLESNLVRRARRVFATSSVDAEKFRLFYGVCAAKLGLCPNGYDEDEIWPVAGQRRQTKRQGSARPKLLFIGSAHYPNVEAGRWLAGLAKSLPECDIVVAGSVSGTLGADLPSNLQTLGRVGPQQKLNLFAEADLFLNPVVLGSGTSLKGIEALGAGLPMVSTPEGVRGLDLENGVHAVVAHRTEFSSSIRGLLGDPDTRRRLSEEGLKHAKSCFTWNAIARSFIDQLRGTAKQPQPGPVRPLALALNDFPVTNAMGGGPARILNLHDNLDLDLVVVTFGATYDINLREPGRLHVTVVKTAAHQDFQDAINAGQRQSANDVVAMLFAGSHPNLRTIVADIALRAGLVIFEHCYMAPLLDIVAAVCPHLPVIYSAHNVEAALKREILRDHPLRDGLAAAVDDVEKSLVKRASLIVCCTDIDARHFAAAGVPTVVAANGCIVPDAQALAQARARGRRGLRDEGRVGFLGSAHGPNVQAAEFIIAELAPAFPEIRFEFVGGVCGAIGEDAPANVCLHGVVGEGVKRKVLSAWDVALNPLEVGGGSSLKLPDYLAHGLPTLNTPTGVRGFNVQDLDACRVAPLERFAAVLESMLAAPDRLASLGEHAYRYAARYLSWQHATESYRARVSALTVPPGPAPRGSLLVVTYRYTEPPLGGVEEYLTEVLKQLRPRFDRIDLAAVDIGLLGNEHHFACRVEQDRPGQSRMIGSLFDSISLFKPDVLDPDAVVELCRRLERAWGAEEAQLYRPFLGLLTEPGRPHLFGGFFSPKDYGGVVRRWTSPEFAFVIPAQVLVFSIAGWVPFGKILELTLLRVPPGRAPVVIARHQRQILRAFRESFELPQVAGGDPLVLRFSVPEHQAKGDHRSFGVLLEAATILYTESDNATDSDVASIRHLRESAADLTEDLDRRFREQQFPLWVRTLREIAQSRPDAVERDFAAARGPHSVDLQVWLTAHAGAYDTVLVQGILFDVIPRTVETLRGLPQRPRIIVLPHFHGDDRFYHWRRYFDAFAHADETLMFSQSIADLVGGPAHFAIVPGGGIRFDEYGRRTDIARFRELHPSSNPFFLVLGRKTPSKGYARVVRSVDALRRYGSPVELVLIGPDEDRVPIDVEGVHLLGPQPREVVRGALSECIALVTMSTSESFGIVLCEAWLFGKPVIANKACYSFRELVADSETGLLVSDQRELEAALDHLATTPAECQAMGLRGREVALERFMWHRVACDVYDSLAGSKRSGLPKSKASRIERMLSSPAQIRLATAKPS